MTQPLRRFTRIRGISPVPCFLIFLVIPASLIGQATEPEGMRSPLEQQTFPRPSPPPIPPVTGNLPGPNTRPTPEQSQAYINSNPSLRTLDPSLKQALIYNQGNGWFNSPILPNGQQNPLYHNGQTTSNWYLPTTWSSPSMNWQGVQNNGFLPSSVASSYYASSITAPAYNPNTAYAPYRSFDEPRVQPTKNTPSSPPQNPSLKPSQTINATVPRVSNSLGPNLSEVKKAIETTERTLALSETAGDKVAQITNHAALARLFVQQGNLSVAFMHLAAAEPMAEVVEDPRVRLDFLRTRATAYLSSGEFEKSIDVNQQALSILRSLADESGQAEVHTSMGWAYQSLGDVPRALTSYEGGRELFSKVGNKNGEVRVRLGIGSLYQSAGEFTKAVEQYNKAVPIASPDQYASMLVSVAEMDQSIRSPKAALAYYEKALSFTKSSSDLSLQGAILAGMGRCHMALGNYQNAKSVFERAQADMKDAGNRLGEAGVITSMGELNYWIAVSSWRQSPKRYFLEALANYNIALPLMHERGDRVGEIGVLTNIGLVYDVWDKPKEAVSYYLEALNKMDELQSSARLEEFRIDIAAQAASLYQRAVQLEFKLKHIQEAFNLSERARARTFLDQLGNTRIDLTKNASPDFIQLERKLRRENISLQRQLQQELARPAPEVDFERTRSLQSGVAAVRKQYEDAISQLKLSNPGYASFLSVSPLTLREVQQQLAPTVTVLSYFATPEMTLVFVVSRDSLHVANLHVTERELLAAITSFRDFAGQGDQSPTLKTLYKWLIGPIKSEIKTPLLAVVPYGVIHEVAFAALTPDGKHYLGDGYGLFYLPSLSVLPYIHETKKPYANVALVLANDQGEGLSHLKRANDEAWAVASQFGTQPLLGEAATTAVLRGAAGNYGFIHLIAHIEIDSENPEFSRILLGEGNGSPAPLMLNDVYGLDLGKTNLVVLSGCQSQRGRRTRGDDIIGLSRAFMYAGAPSVVASLWSVDDDATRQLMVAFYTHLKEGLNKAESLRAAQIAVRQKYPNPFYWAGFALTGDPSPLMTSKVISAN